jgi:MFS family permease
MTENFNGKTPTRSKSYFRYMLFVLMLITILDGYVTSVNPVIAQQMANTFFPDLSSDQQNSILQLGNAVVSVGLLVVFFMQYLADKIGRKKSLAITAIGMGIATLGMFFSQNYFMYVAFWFFLSFFMSSDIWLIYVNEEAKPKKRATTTNIVLAGGLTSGFLMFIFRTIFIPEEDPNPFWRGMFLLPMILGIIMGIVVLTTLKESSKYLENKDELKQESRNLIQDFKCCFDIEEKKSYKFLLLVNFIFTVSIAAYMTLKIKFLEDNGFTSPQIGIVILANTFLIIIAFILNALSDRFGRKLMACLWAILLPISAILLVISAETLNSFPMVLLSNTINGIAYFGMNGILKLITLELLPNDRRGTGSGVRQLSSAVGVIIGMISSAIVVRFIPTGIMFIIFSCLVLISVPIIALKFKETKGVDLSLIK